MLNRSGKSGYSCLVSDLRRKAFRKALNFSPLSMLLAMGLSYVAFYYVEICPLYIHTLLRLFIINGC